MALITCALLPCYCLTVGSPLWPEDHPGVSSQALRNSNATGFGAHGNVGGLGIQKQPNTKPRWPRPYLKRASHPKRHAGQSSGSSPVGLWPPAGFQAALGALLLGLAGRGSKAGRVGRAGCLDHFAPRKKLGKSREG